MNYDFAPLKKKSAGVREWLLKEFSGIRTGRATPALIENLEVDAYGSKNIISHIASISLEDPKTLRVAPWDKTHIPAIQNALSRANLGISASADEIGIRVKFPTLTEETRKSITKIVRERLEEARISLRKERDNVWEDIQTKERGKEISKDDKFRFKDEMEKIISESAHLFEEAAKKKENEILTQ